MLERVLLQCGEDLLDIKSGWRVHECPPPPPPAPPSPSVSEESAAGSGFTSFSYDCASFVISSSPLKCRSHLKQRWVASPHLVLWRGPPSPFTLDLQVQGPSWVTGAGPHEQHRWFSQGTHQRLIGTSFGADRWAGGCWIGLHRWSWKEMWHWRDVLEQLAFLKVKTFADSARDTKERRQHRVMLCVCVCVCIARV